MSTDSNTNKMLSRLSGLKFSEIKNCDIVDANNDRIGRLIDAIFSKKDDGMHLTKFLVGGSRFEEMMESLGLKADIDPVFPVDLIDSISPKRIKLNRVKNDLKSTTLDDDAIGPNEVKLTGLSKMKLYDSRNQDIGNIIDMKFEKKSFKFIIGDGVIRELMEDLGLVADVDFLLNPKYVSSIDEKKITLSQSRVELKDTFDRHLPELQKAAANAKLEKHMHNYIFP